MPKISKSTLRSASLGAVLLASIANLATAQVTWDGGAGSSNWADALNWSNNLVPTNATSVLLDASAPSTISLTSASRSVGTLTFSSAATSSISLTNTTTAGLISLGNGNSIVVESGSANHAIARVATTRNATINVGGSAILTDTFHIFGSDLSGTNVNNFTKSGTGTLLMGGVQNGGESRGLITVSAGTLDIRGNLEVGRTNAQNHTLLLAGSAGATLTNGGGTTVTLAFGRNSGRTTSDALDQTFAGQITGNINFQLGNTSTLAGAQSTNFTGTQTLTGNNAYTGTTTVNQGTLVSTGSTSGQGNYTIRGTTAGTAAKTGTFRGTGSIGLASGATFTVGSASQIANSRGQLETGATSDAIGTLSIGTLGNGNSLVFTNGSTWEVDFDNTANDRIDVVGSVSIGATDTLLHLDSLGFTSGLSTYTLLSSTGSISGTFASVFLDGAEITGSATSGFMIGSQTYSLVYGANDITLAAIPEPSAFAALAGLFGLGLAATRRRRA